MNVASYCLIVVILHLSIVLSLRCFQFRNSDFANFVSPLTHTSFLFLLILHNFMFCFGFFLRCWGGDSFAILLFSFAT